MAAPCSLQEFASCQAFFTPCALHSAAPARDAALTHYDLHAGEACCSLCAVERPAAQLVQVARGCRALGGPAAIGVLGGKRIAGSLRPVPRMDRTVIASKPYARGRRPSIAPHAKFAGSAGAAPIASSPARLPPLPPRRPARRRSAAAATTMW